MINKVKFMSGCIAISRHRDERTKASQNNAQRQRTLGLFMHKRNTRRKATHEM